MNETTRDTFHETQWLVKAHWWLGALIAIAPVVGWWAFVQQIVLHRPFGNNPGPDWLVWLIWVVVGFVMPALLFAARMTTRVSAHNLRLVYFPLYSRTIPLDGIESCETVEYRPIRDFGGWGIRWSLAAVFFLAVMAGAGYYVFAQVLQGGATVKVPDVELPEASVAVQVTMVTPTGNTAGASLVIAGSRSARSVAVAIPMLTWVPAGSLVVAETFAGTCSVGRVVSVTATVWVAKALLPDASCAVQVTVVMPTGKPAGASFEIVATPTASDTTGVPSATGVLGPVASTVTVGGATMLGEVVSATVTVKLPVAMLPAASAAEQMTGVVPRGKRDPEGRLNVTCTGPSTASTASAT